MTPHRRLVGTLLRARSGAASVEFAITFMVVLVAVLGIFELGFIFLSQRGIDRGVTESARWIAVNIVYPSGVTAPAPGVVVTVTAQFRWTPLTTLVNIAAITLISSAALTIQD